MNLSGVGEKTERKLKKIGILKAEDFYNIIRTIMNTFLILPILRILPIWKKVPL